MIWLATGLYLGAAMLILLEFVLPGGILGATGALMMVGSAGVAIYAFPEYAIPILIVQFIGLAATIALGLYLLSRTGAGKALLLGTSQREEDGYVNVASNVALVGATGTVRTALRPAGSIEVRGTRLDAVADGAFIDEGAAVRVVEVHGNRIVVEACEDKDTAGELPPTP